VSLSGRKTGKSRRGEEEGRKKEREKEEASVPRSRKSEKSKPDVETGS
jgi:hypothetical protein